MSVLFAPPNLSIVLHRDQLKAPPQTPSTTAGYKAF